MGDIACARAFACGSWSGSFGLCVALRSRAGQRVEAQSAADSAAVTAPATPREVDAAVAQMSDQDVCAVLLEDLKTKADAGAGTAAPVFFVDQIAALAGLQ